MLAPQQNGHRSVTLRQRSLTLALVAITVFAVIPGCSAKYPTAPEPSAVAIRIHVAATVFDLFPNRTAQFVAYEIDSNGVYTDVTGRASWSTSDPGVISTAFEGNRRIVRGVSPGDADLIVSYGGHTDAVTLRIHSPAQPVPRIELSGSSSLPSLNLNRPQTSTIQVRSIVQNLLQSGQVVTTAAAITSSDPNVATVDGGTIRPVAPGTVRIVATYNGLTATALTSVAPTPAPRQ